MIDKRKAVFIEYCVNCNNHSWCTKHDEAKYHHFFVLIKDEIEREFKNVIVYGNINPRTGLPMTPKLGTFEVTFREQLVFSKLKTTVWPGVDVVTKRMQAVIEGRNFNDFGAGEQNQKPRKPPASKAILRNITSKNRLQNNNSYLGPEYEQRSIVKDHHRQEHSMMDLVNESREEHLPPISRNPKQRNYTPTRLEGSGSRYMEKYMERSSSRQYVRLAYLDADRRIVNVPKDYQAQYMQRKYASREAGSFNDQNSVYSNYSTNTKYSGGNGYTNQGNQSNYGDYENYSRKDSMGSLQRGTNPRQDYQTDARRSTGSGSVPVSKRHYRDYRQEAAYEQEREMNETSMYTDKTRRTEESDQTSIMRKRDVNYEGNHHSLPSNKRRDDSYENPSRTNITTPHTRNQSTNTSPKEVSRPGPLNPDLAGLYKVDYPEQKLSEIHISRNKVTKKKITITSDEPEECRVNIYATDPEILTSESEIRVPKGAPFKIGLRFAYEEGVQEKDWNLFIFKNDQPWQKIIIKANYHSG